MSLCVTVFLAFVLSLSIVLTQMPHSSLRLSAHVTYLALLATCSALSVLLSSLVLHLHHRHGNAAPVGPRWERFARCVRRYRKKISDTLKNPMGCLGEKVEMDSQLTFQENDTKVADVLRLTSPEEEEAWESSGLPKTAKSTMRETKEKRRMAEEEDRVTWEHVAESLDFVLFRCFFTVVLVGTVASMVFSLDHYTEGSQL